MGCVNFLDICVIHQALLGNNKVPRPNIGSLLCSHFHRQRPVPAGAILCGGLVTRISNRKNIQLPKRLLHVVPVWMNTI
jgi:hypothetical protein